MSRSQVTSPKSRHQVGKAKEAYCRYWSGIYSVIEYPSQKVICKSKHFNRAMLKGRKLGYQVRVFMGDGRGGTKSEVYPPIVADSARG